MIKVVLLDGDGVLLKKHKYFSEMYAEKHGVDLEKITPFFTGPFGACKKGQADVKEELAPYLKDWGWDKSVDEFLDYWFTSDTVEDEQVVAEAQKLREKGLKCYLASDQEKYRAEYIKSQTKLGQAVDGLFVSCDMGCSKSEPVFFEKVLKQLSVESSEVLYWDDEEENVAVAKKLGIDARVYTSFDDFVEQMQSIL